MDKGVFDVLILTGRPASGKSEIIDFLLHAPADRRIEEYHMGDLSVLDDFPMLWAWFEEDAILAKKLGKPRLHTDEEGYFKYDYLWDVLIERLMLDYQKLQREWEESHTAGTAIIEFSRGTEHGGYRRAFSRLSTEVLNRAAIMYVNVSFEESLRKNRRRFNPKRPDSILEHSLPDHKLERLYRFDDWADLTAEDREFLTIQGVPVPYMVFDNHDDVTTGKPEILGERLQYTLDVLYKKYVRQLRSA